MDDLEARIAARLTEALDRMAATDASTYEVRGLANREPAEDPVIRLTIDDVARIAAQEARAWF